jgi:DNA-binding winged helix-turn-helix (wHTH) protein
MIYRFEAFELDAGRYELRCGGQARRLPRKSFDVLHLMLEHAGRVVTKREIFTKLWKGEHVREAVLPVHVRTIRRVLGARASASILHTVRGRGYRIACRVERVASPAAPALAPTTPAPRRAAPPRDGPGKRGDALAALSQMSGMLSLALVLGDLGLTGDSLEQLVARHS